MKRNPDLKKQISLHQLYCYPNLIASFKRLINKHTIANRYSYFVFYLFLMNKSKRYVHYVPVHFLIVPRPKKFVGSAIKLHAKNR
jgi:uncharacterized protein YfbU (UPF0304 family)